MPQDPRPQRRIVASEEQWGILRESLLGGKTCACGCGRAAHSLHHLVGRGVGGGDVKENLIPLNGDGTRGCHGALTSWTRVYDMKQNTYIDPVAVRTGVRLNLRPECLGYILRTKGRDWLDDKYPL